MNYEQVCHIDETLINIRHTLANSLVETGFVREYFGTLSLEKRKRFADHWQAMHRQTIHDLQDSLTMLDTILAEQAQPLEVEQG